MAIISASSPLHPTFAGRQHFRGDGSPPGAFRLIRAPEQTLSGRRQSVNASDRRRICGYEWTFAGSDSGGHRAAAVCSLIETCKLDAVDPRAWPADVLAELPDHPAQRIAELTP
jgi:hypothetical protein